MVHCLTDEEYVGLHGVKCRQRVRGCSITQLQMKRGPLEEYRFVRHMLLLNLLFLLLKQGYQETIKNIPFLDH